MSAKSASWAHVAAALAARSERLFVIEASAGGVISASMTAQPGASRWFAGALVAYDDALKTTWLRVDPTCIVQHGAVSGEVVAAMLDGAAERAGWIIAESGIYGPAGDRPGKPVGSCHVGLRRPDGQKIVRAVQLSGNRAQMRIEIQQQVRDLLLEQLDAGADR